MTKILLALAAGGLSAMSFAPFYWWPLGMVSFAMLFCLWLMSNTRVAVMCGFAYGLGLFGVGVSWMYISIHTFGGMPPAMAGFTIFLGVCFISIYPAVCGWVQGLFSNWNATVRLTIIMPGIWILFEWLRGWLFTGFPWLSVGYAYLDTPLSNYAPIGGVYLVGLIVLVSVGLLIAIIRNLTGWNGMIALLMIGIWLGGWQLNETAWTRAEGEPISVAIIQNDVPLIEKWDEEKNNQIIAEYMAKSQAHKNADLIVWPEAAIPDYIENIANTFWHEIERHPADFVFGVLHKDNPNGTTEYYNSVAAVSDKIMIYRKQHLVPFGEYFPLQNIFGALIEMLNIPMSDFTAWTHPQLPLEAAGNKFAVSICFEDAFPNEWKNQIESAGALLNVSEDIWFGDSFAPHQRLQMARFRSRESERPMIRSSNNGLSSLINWKGGIDKLAPQFTQHVVTGSIQPRMGTTPYNIFGEKPILTLVGLLLLLGILFGRSNKR